MDQGHLWRGRKLVFGVVTKEKIPVKRPPQSMFLPGTLPVAWA